METLTLVLERISAGATREELDIMQRNLVTTGVFGTSHVLYNEHIKDAQSCALF